MINKAIDISLFPSQWKMAKVFPLYKKDYRTDAQNYRPATSKISERVVYDQLPLLKFKWPVNKAKTVWISFPSFNSNSVVTFNK